MSTSTGYTRLSRSEAFEIEAGVIDYHRLMEIKAMHMQRRAQMWLDDHQPAPGDTYDGIPVHQFGRAAAEPVGRWEGLVNAATWAVLLTFCAGVWLIVGRLLLGWLR